MNEPATEEWINERWGGFNYLLLSRNEDFSLNFLDGRLCLIHETCDDDSEASRLLLIESPTRQQVIEVEKLFGCKA